MSLLFSFFSVFYSFCQKDGFKVDDYLIGVTASENLDKSLKILHSIKLKNEIVTGDSIFTILHFGDSHIQGDYFSGELRRQLQSYFGNAGQGIIFPYSICKSYGPKGIKVNSTGIWNGVNILKNTSKKEIGMSGYSISTLDSNSKLNFNISENFKGEKSNEISIWTSGGPNSFDYNLNPEMTLKHQDSFDNGWLVRDYKSNTTIDSFTISLQKSNTSNNKFYFQGFEYKTNSDFGINYHHCGVVGAQFIHLVQNSDLIKQQLEFIKPNLIIFSFGTNEAYNQSLDTSFYYNSISKFLIAIQNSLPETAMIITTAPDTRSQGKTPPNQVNVNNQLTKISKNLNLSLFDLNKAMGGWGSLFKWNENNLTLKDKLHFNAEGYKLQGQMMSFAILNKYNMKYPHDSLPLNGLKESLREGLKPIFFQKENTEIQDSTIKILPEKQTINPQKKIISKKTPKTFYTVKQGDTIYAIARQKKTSVKKVLDANNLKENSIIVPGQRLVIPLN